MILREQYQQKVVGTLFTQSQLHFLLGYWLKGGLRKEVITKNLYYLFEGRLYQVLLVLEAPINYQTPQL
jgi:hypothetical protein